MSNKTVIENTEKAASLARRYYYYINNINYHKSHRFAFSFEYSGTQPVSNVVSYFGRKGTIKKYRLDYPEYKAIVFTYPKALLLWIKHPPGTKTVTQLINARKLARACVQSITKKYRLHRIKEGRTGFSEHTVENRYLDKLLRPLVEKEPELIRSKCGITINKTSHKGKLEHTDRERVDPMPPAKDRVNELERVLYGKTATKEDIHALMDLIKKQTESTLELNSTLRELMLGSVKPPEKPLGHDHI